VSHERSSTIVPAIVTMLTMRANGGAPSGHSMPRRTIALRTRSRMTRLRGVFIGVGKIGKLPL